MRDNGTRIIDDFLHACSVGHPDFKALAGSITVVYKRDSFEDVFKTIGELYHTLVCFHIPTKYLNIDVAYPVVKVKLDYRALKVLYPVYDEDEEEEGE